MKGDLINENDPNMNSATGNLKCKIKPTRLALLKNFLEELKKIATVGLACKATNYIEKILWIAFGGAGIVWAVFFLTTLFQEWEESAGIMTRGNFVLNYPAITICPKVSNKYAITEQLGNFLDQSNIPDQLLSLRESFFLCGSGLLGDMDNVHFLDVTSQKAMKYYEDNCLFKIKRKMGCEVNFVV